MAHVLVAGSVNVDRVWRLEEPLQPGGRATWLRVESRCGGGGFNTGATLLALGHSVTLVASLADDDSGHACLERLRGFGFDTGHVGLTGRRTTPLQIFLDPAGERTIVAPASTEHHRLTSIPDVAADLAYLNVRRAGARTLALLARRMPVVSQVPLQADERRPAEVLIASASDHPFAGEDAFAAACRIGGSSLCTLLVTDGPGPVRIVTGAGTEAVAVPALGAAAETTGAGDAFAAGVIDARLAGAAPRDAVERGIAVAARYLTGRDGFWTGSPALPELEDRLTAVRQGTSDPPGPKIS